MLPEPPGYLKQVMGYGGIWSRTGESTMAYSSTVVIIVVYSLEFFVAHAFIHGHGLELIHDSSSHSHQAMPVQNQLA